MRPYGKILHNESRVIVSGLPRYGKTRFVRDVLTRDATRVVWHDVVGHDYYAPGRLRVSIDELEAAPEYLDRDIVRIVVIAQSAGDSDVLKDEVTRLVRLIAQVGHIVIVLDEVQAHNRKTDKILNGLFARGNHWGIVPVLSSQRASDIPLGARTNASDVYAFGQHHPDELKVIYNAYGDVFAAQCAHARKGDKPLHWRDSEREKWWSEKARGKYAAIHGGG